LIGNKVDLSESRVVSSSEGRALALKYGINFYETSAKNNINVVDAFLDIATQVVNNFEESIPKNIVDIENGKGGEEQKSGCCLGSKTN